MIRWSRIWSLVVKEFKSVLADKNNRNMILLSPLLQLVLFANVASLEIKKVFISVYDKDNTELSRTLTEKFEKTPIIKKVYHINNDKEMKELVDKEKVFVAITIPQDFAKNIYDGSGTDIQIIIDGRRSNSSQIVASYISSIIHKFAGEINEAEKIQQPVEIRTRNLFNPTLNYQWFICVCLTGVLAMNMAFSITALAIAQEKELGTFEQTIVSPLTSLEIIIGKTIPAILIALFDVTLMIIGSILLFKVPIEGSIFMIYFSVFVFLLAMSGIGLSLSTICKTQQQSVLGMSLLSAPLMMLSGFMSPVENMSWLAQKIAMINPLTYFFELLKGIFLRNIGMITIFENIVPLMLIAGVTLTFSWWFFNKNLS